MGVSMDKCLYVIPNDSIMREQLLNIDRMTKDSLARCHKIFVPQDWQCNTMANSYIESLIRTLELSMRQAGEVAINFYDMFTAHVTVKTNNDAEKNGNINIEFIPGPTLQQIIGRNVADAATEEPLTDITAVFGFGDDKTNPSYAQFSTIDRIAMMDLSEKYSITSPKDWLVTAVAYRFIENLVKYMMIALVAEDASLVSVNFNDNIEFHAMRTDNDSVKITLRPGMNAKLLIKSDELTEMDDEE